MKVKVLKWVRIEGIHRASHIYVLYVFAKRMNIIIHATCWIFFTTGNFGVVYKAYYTREGVQTKVAIKTLKGDNQ